MAKRHGTVLVFKKGTSETQIRKALDGLRDILEPEAFCESLTKPAKLDEYRLVPYRVEEYDDTYGGPVWYCP